MKAGRHRRRRKERRRTRRPGEAPGTLQAAPDAHGTTLRVVRYDARAIDERAASSAGELPLAGAGGIVWIDVVGLGDVELLAAIGKRLDLHPLALEDAVNLHQRPKLEAYDQDLFLVARMCQATAEGESGMDSEQLSMVLRPGLVITFQERPGDCFDGVRERLRVASRRIRSRGADYLAYALLDTVVDGYQPVIDQLEERLEAIEERLLDEPEEHDLKALHRVRRELIGLRRGVAPLRDAVLGLMRGPEASHVVTEETQLFLRDCYDHVVRTTEQIDGFRDLCASLMDMYLSTVSNRTNDVMKVLTMIATIFIPLSFLVGLYGMNFDTGSPWNMPELGLPYGYPVLVGIMVAVAAGLLWYFKRKGWL